MSRQKPSTLSFTRRKLPHWLVADATYFITIRLKGSLPKGVTDQLKQERADLLDREPPYSEKMLQLERKQFAIIDGILDACRNSPNWLQKKEVAICVIDAMPWLCERGWDVIGVLMPNHAHLLMRNWHGRTAQLKTDLGCFKSYTGDKANNVLDRNGAFWMPENFDHWCRTPEKVESAKRYIDMNPVKAGLIDQSSEWPWFFDFRHTPLD